MSRRGWLLFAAMAVIWGIPYLLIKVAVGELAPATLVLARTTVAATILVPLAIARGDVKPLLPRWRWVVAYTFVEVAAPWILLSDAERRLSSSLAGLLIAGVPLVGALLVWLIGGDDRPDLRRVVGLIVGFIGEVGPVRSTVITYFNPAVAIVLGVMLLNEPFTPGIAIGFALIAAGSFFATRRVRGMRGAAAAFPEGAP